jgi:hypothetical protein
MVYQFSFLKHPARPIHKSSLSFPRTLDNMAFDLNSLPSLRGKARMGGTQDLLRSFFKTLTWYDMVLCFFVLLWLNSLDLN